MDAGIRIVTESNGLTGLMLPIFAFDGAADTKIDCSANAISVHYRGWVCRYTADAQIVDTGKTCTNRNGQYRIFRAEKHGKVTVNIAIELE